MGVVGSCWSNSRWRSYTINYLRSHSSHMGAVEAKGVMGATGVSRAYQGQALREVPGVWEVLSDIIIYCHVPARWCIQQTTLCFGQQQDTGPGVASSVTERSGTQAVSKGGQFHETNIEATWNLLGYEGLNTIVLHGHHSTFYLHLTRALYELII